ncbi:MAG: hypothetical protein M3466_12745 [Gemmatimonadota bacterium]|nr:hypothetical protein [Gemmatimonadota bacterium]
MATGVAAGVDGAVCWAVTGAAVAGAPDNAESGIFGTARGGVGADLVGAGWATRRESGAAIA